MTKHIGILIYDDVQPMDFIGPWEVFSFWKNILNAPINLSLVSEKGGLVNCDNNITVKAHYDFANAPQFDYFIVPGGKGRREQVHNEKLIAFIKQQATKCEYLISICTGMFLLYQAGLLKQKSATTYWRAFSELQKLPDVKVVSGRIVKNGNIWTAGGVTSGIDLALEFIAEIAGKETAGKVQLLLEYFPEATLYCSESTFKELPAYNEYEPVLPDYIREYIEKG